MSMENALAHRDFFKEGDFGNVKVRIKTGYQYEEINKCFIFGQLAEKLAKELNYSEPVFIFFDHNYTANYNCKSDFFISYTQVELQHLGNGVFLKDNAILIHQIAKQFQAEPLLKLLEYAILNLENIKSAQTEIQYNKNHRNMEIKTIDTLSIKEILNASNSDLLNNVLQLRMDRPEEDFRKGISYYWQNSRYFVFLKYPDIDLSPTQESVLLEIENIYGFQKFMESSAIIFDTDSSFYAVKQHISIPFGSGEFIFENKPQVFPNQVIENTFGQYQPFKIESIDGDKFWIYFWYYSKEASYQQTSIKHRILTYLLNDDELIPVSDELIKE